MTNRINYWSILTFLSGVKNRTSKKSKLQNLIDKQARELMGTGY
jgi:hypothetical protein